MTSVRQVGGRRGPVPEQGRRARPSTQTAQGSAAYLLRHPARPASHSFSDVRVQAQTGAGEDGIEVGEELVLWPRWRVMPQPAPRLRRAADACETPSTMRKVTGGSFEGGKTLDDYFPDLVGTRTWGSNNKAGPFDNGFRAGSSVQLIGEYPSPCAKGGPFSLGQRVTIKRMRGDGKKLLEKGKPLEGQTLDDIARSGRDSSRAPFRQEYGFAVTMADPISGAPYSSFTDYDLQADLTTSITGAGGTKSVAWGVTIESRGGSVTRNEVR